MQHPNIVKMHTMLEDEKAYCIVLENLKNGTFERLLEKRKRLSEIEVRYYGL